jgi:hypothetical protein
MGQPLVPHSGYRQRQAKLFNYVKTQGAKDVIEYFIRHKKLEDLEKQIAAIEERLKAQK